MGDCRVKSLVRSSLIVGFGMFVFSIVMTMIIALYCREGLIHSQREYVEHIANLTLQDTQTEDELQEAKKYIQKIEKNWDIQWFPRTSSDEDLEMQNYTSNDAQGILVKELKNFSIIIKYDIETINDETRNFTVTIFCMILITAELIGVIIVICIKKIVLNTMLRKMQCIQDGAEKDKMTQLFNKCRFISKIRYYNSCTSIGVIYVDVNDLKKANDTYGHIVGNELICSVATVMKSLEFDDLECYRFGGDEFVIILPNYSKTKVEKVKSNLLENIEKITLKLAPIQVSVACGIAFQNKSIDVEKAIDQADEDMYECKKNQKQNK